MAGRLELLMTAVVWAGFCLVLAHAGHDPWYRLQAALLPFWLVGAGELYARLAGVIARRLGSEVDRGVSLRRSLAWPILLGFVLPDIIVYTVWGFDALFPAMLVYGGLTVLVSLGWGVWAMRLGVRGALAVVPAWFAQAVFCALVLR